MMMFFETLRGASFPLSDIDSIGPEQEPKPGTFLRCHTVRLKSEGFEGFGVEVSSHEARRILQAGHPVIPAEPGTVLLTFVAPRNAEPEQWRAVRSPILAWRIENDEPHPITIEHRYGGDGYTAILMPDGQIVDEMGESWTSVSAFESDARGWVIADREETKASEATA